MGGFSIAPLFMPNQSQDDMTIQLVHSVLLEKIENVARNLEAAITNERVLREQLHTEFAKFYDRNHQQLISDGKLWRDAHLREHAMNDRSVLLAKNEVDRRLGDMNELRQQITSERAMYLTRSAFEDNRSETSNWRDTVNKFMNIALTREFFDKAEQALVDSARSSDERLNTRIKALEDGNNNLQGRFWALGAAIGSLVVIVNVGLYLLNHFTA